jgi:hypothetical protein
MVIRFRIPTSIAAAGTFERKVELDADKLSPEKVRDTLQCSGLLPRYDALCRYWNPHVERALSSLPHDAAGQVNPATGLYEPARDTAARLCYFIGWVYLGRRLGSVRFEFSHRDSETGALVTSDDTVMMLSTALNSLSELLGKQRAAEVFTSLERAADRFLRSPVPKAK